MGTTVLLKWTPNGLMDSSGPAPSDSNVGQSKVNFPNSGTRKKSPVSWQQAISINIATVLYIHCHQVSRNKYLTVFYLYPFSNKSIHVWANYNVLVWICLRSIIILSFIIRTQGMKERMKRLMTETILVRATSLLLVLMVSSIHILASHLVTMSSRF